MKSTCEMQSANGAAPILIEKILDSELGAHCALYARVTIPAGSILGYHEHHGNISPDRRKSRSDGYQGCTGHGVDNSAGTEPIVFMALVVNK